MTHKKQHNNMTEQTFSFNETQYFRRWWVWLLIATLNVPFVYGIISQVYMDVPFGNHPMSDGGLIAAYFFILLITVMLLTARLETRIDADGVHLRYPPFIRHEKHFTWTETAKAELVAYHPIADYGGFGIRGTRRNRAYNVAGRHGLRLTLRNGRCILIGTQQPEMLEQAVQRHFTPFASRLSK